MIRAIATTGSDFTVQHLPRQAATNVEECLRTLAHAKFKDRT